MFTYQNTKHTHTIARADAVATDYVLSTMNFNDQYREGSVISAVGILRMINIVREVLFSTEGGTILFVSSMMVRTGNVD